MFPDAVVVGCTIAIVLRTFIATARSSMFRMYAHVNDTLEPESSLGNRKFRFMPSSKDRGFVELKLVWRTHTAAGS